jgi:nitrous oxidase accessory protein
MTMKRCLSSIGMISIIFLSQSIVVFSNPIKDNYEHAFETWYYVDDEPGSGPNNPPEDFTSIQDAIDAVSDGDTIFVYNGMYKEHLFIVKAIKLLGESKYDTIIDAEYIDNTIWVLSPNVTISGFSVINSINNRFSAGIHVRDKYIHISNCFIQDNDCGIRVEQTSDVSIGNCTIHNNFAHSIYVIAASNVSITYCNISYNGDVIGYSGGIVIINSEIYGMHANILIQNCSIHDNSGSGIDVGNPWENLVYKDVMIEHNQIVNNTNHGIFSCASIVTVRNNIIAGNGHNRSFDGGIMLQDVHGLATIQNNILSNNKNGIYFLRSTDNTIQNNNFISNTKQQIGFTYNDSIISSNYLINNYYSDLKYPWMKIIGGLYINKIVLPLINIEWNPATKPHDLS